MSLIVNFPSGAERMIKKKWWFVDLKFKEWKEYEIQVFFRNLFSK